MNKLATVIILAFLIQTDATFAKPGNSNLRIQETETRTVANFTGISLNGHFNVFVTLGDTESLQIEASAEALKEIETPVENGILKIRPKVRIAKPYADFGEVTIRITAKSLDALALSGSGSITIDGTISAKTLSTSVSGSGSLNFDTDVSDLKALISGSGAINTGGKATHAVVTISGSGKFAANGLKTNTSDIRLTGSGQVNIDTKDHLSVILIGSGNIVYTGDPHVDIVTKIGSGNITRIE